MYLRIYKMFCLRESEILLGINLLNRVILAVLHSECVRDNCFFAALQSVMKGSPLVDAIVY